MNQEAVFTTLESFDNAFVNQASNLLETIFNEKVSIVVENSKVFNPELLKNSVGIPSLRLDFNIPGKDKGLTYFANGKLLPDLTGYLSDDGDNPPNIPDSMQMIMDVSEQLSMIKKQCFDEVLSKGVEFDSPALSAWDGSIDMIFSESILTFYKMQIGEKNNITLVRMIPADIVAEYFDQDQAGENGGVESEDFEDFSDAEEHIDAQQSIDFIHDLELLVTVELGRVTMTLKDMLALGPGSIVELNKFAGEPVEVYVNNKKFAEGEVVVIDQNFAVRITSLVAKRDRFASLRV